MSGRVAQDRAGVRLGDRVGIAGAEVGNVLTIVVQNTWLLYFLVNIVDLSPIVAGTIFLLARLVDAVSDPLIGDLIDRRLAKRPRLSWVRLANVPASTAFLAIFALPLIGRQVILLVLVALVIQSILHTFTAMAAVSLIPALARGYDDRTTLSGWRVGAGILTALIGISGPPVIVLAVTGDRELAASAPLGWVVMAAVFSLLMIACYALAVRVIDEPVAAAGADGSRLTYAGLRAYLRVPGLSGVLVLVLVFSVANIISNATLPFFLESVLGLTTGQQGIVLGGFFLLAICFVPLVALLARRLGKPRALALLTAVYCCGLLLLASVQPRFEETLALMGVTAVAALGLSGTLVLPAAMVPDVTEHVALATGQRHDGLVFALAGFAVKLGSSIGIFAAAAITSLVAYESGTATQSASTQTGLAVLIGPVAATAFAVGGVLAWRSTVTRTSSDEAMAALAARALPLPPAD